MREKSVPCVSYLYEEENHASGCFCPQDPEFVSTSDLIFQIARQLWKKIYFSKLLNPFVAVLKPLVPALNSLYGDLYYTKNLPPSYEAVDFQSSVQQSLMGEINIT